MHNFENLPFDSNPCHKEIQFYDMYNGADPIFNSRKPRPFYEISKSGSIYLFFWSSLDTNIEGKLLGLQSQHFWLWVFFPICPIFWHWIFFPIYPTTFHIMQIQPLLTTMPVPLVKDLRLETTFFPIRTFAVFWVWPSMMVNICRHYLMWPYKSGPSSHCVQRAGRCLQGQQFCTSAASAPL